MRWTARKFHQRMQRKRRWHRHWHRQFRRETSGGSVPSEHARHIGCAGGQQSARVSGVHGVLNPTTVVRILGSRTGSRAFGTRRSSSCPQMVQWHAAQHLLAPAHRGEGAGFGARGPDRAHGAPITRVCTVGGAAAAVAPKHTHTCGDQAGQPRGGVPAHRGTRGHNQRTPSWPTSPRASLLYRWWGSFGGQLPHEHLFSIGGGEVEPGSFPLRGTNFPTRPLSL